MPDKIFTWNDKDDVIIEAVNSHRRVKWAAVSKLLKGTTPKMCKARWEKHLKSFPGLHHTAFTNRSPKPLPSTRAPSSPPPPNSSRSSKHKSSPPSSPSARKAGKRSPKLSSSNSNSNSNSNANANANSPINAHKPPDEIVIHVCDEARKINRDFKCDREILTSGMKYFQSYLTDTTAFEEIDISVHCDVHIFEWLMRFIKDPSNPPTLEVSNVVSILISSDFLQMQALVDICLQFFHDHASQIINSLIDLNCISDTLLTSLAKLFTGSELDQIQDKRDKLLSKLYRKCLEIELEQKENYFFKCLRCGKFLTASQRCWFGCRKARAFIDFHGNCIAHHTPNPSWNLQKYLLSLRVGDLSWKEIYWKIWAKLQSLHCKICGQQFVASELYHCSYHPEDALYPRGENAGFYPCCNAPSRRFSAFGGTTSGSGIETGCQGRLHQIDQDNKRDVEIYNILLEHQDIALTPFRSRERGYQVGGLAGVGSESVVDSRGRLAGVPLIATNVDNQHSGTIGADSSSSSSSSKFQSYSRQLSLSDIQAQYEDGAGDPEDRFQKRRLAMFDTNNGAESDGYSDIEDNQTHRGSRNSNNTSNSSSSSRGMRMSINRSNSRRNNRDDRKWSAYRSSKNRPSSSTRRRRKTSSKNIAQSPAQLSTKQRVKKMDLLRDDDRRRMNSLVTRLTSLRTTTRADQNQNSSNSIYHLHQHYYNAPASASSTTTSGSTLKRTRTSKLNR